MKSIAFVQKMFRDYYEDFSLNKSTLMIEKREFGFTSFEGWMLRHKSFKNKEELESFLRDSVPRDVYFSCAYYEDPQAEMEKKGWLGADLIFDIDADHIPTSCDKVHDKWICGNCGFAGKGVAPEKCPACGGEKFNESTWPCETCLASAKAESVKLLDMLTQDFGFSENEVCVFFSGHRGYHVHVKSKSISTLDTVARKEIVDYVCGLGLEVPSDTLNKKSQSLSNVYLGSSSKDFGWRKRIALGVKDVILDTNEQDLVDIGVGRNVAKALLSNKDVISKRLLNEGTLLRVKGVGFESWKKIAEQSIKMQSAKVDTVVTTDIHRLIRLANTLHGKTGFKKVEFPISVIDDFDPFKSAVAFKKGFAVIYVSDAPEFRLGDEMLGPYKNQKVELPTAAAVLLICKGRAEVVE